MGVPGAVHVDGFVAPCVNLNQWGGFYPGESLGSVLNMPVIVTNDANAAALGEYTFGGGKNTTVSFLLPWGLA